MLLGLILFAISICYGIFQIELFSISHAKDYQLLNTFQFEIVFILIQVFAAWKLYGSRTYFDQTVTHLLIISLIFSSFTDLSFIIYGNSYNGVDAAAHIMELFSYYVIYRVFVTTNLSRPFDSVFRNLKLHEKELKCSRDELERRVFERTKELGIINNNLQSEIEERKKKEIALQESEERFRVVLKNSKITVAHCDLNLRYTWIHSPILNPDQSQMIGFTDTDISPMRGSSDLMELKKSVLTSRAGKRTEIIFDFTDKKIIHDVTAEPLYNDHGDLIGVTTASVDITDRREVEEALKIRHRALESIYQIVTGEGRLSDSIYNKICENIAGILDISYVLIGRIQDSAINILSQYSNSGHKHPENFTMQKCPCEKIFSEKILVKIDGVLDDSFPDNNCFAHQDIHSYIGVPVFDENRTVIGVICVLDNKKREYSQEELHIVEIFSRYISYEFERETFQRELLQSREMKILGQLTSGVAHEVRNPLNAIWAITEALFRELESQENISVYREHIRSQVERLTRLMQDLLDFGKPFNLNGCSRVSITNFLSTVIVFWNQTNSSSEHPIELIKPEDGEEYNIKADVNKLQQMMINILDNASQHSPIGSPITIEWKKLNQSTCSITVADRGCGIPPENLDQIFEPFFTTRKKGIGLGLSIVKHIIETHHGSIKIKNNTPLPGATVEIRLPFCPDPSEKFDDGKKEELFTKQEKITV
jgi:signal transduction histidine kinase/PAS domain-containing protein